MASSKKAGSTNELVLNRDYILSSTMGHSVEFKKGVPTHVPPIMYRAALGIGAAPADGTEPALENDRDPDTAPIDPGERAEVIYAIILKIVEDNINDEFTAANAPKEAAVSKRAGFKVQTKELKPLWQRYHDEKAGENA
jgi:hypothetical protein